MSLLQRINYISDKWFKNEKGRFISTRKAKEIQESANHTEFETIDNKCTPPYLKIVEQLTKNNEQLFRAAVYNLYKIAEQQEQYRMDIAVILEEKIKEDDLEPELADYLEEKYKKLHRLLIK